MTYKEINNIVIRWLDEGGPFLTFSDIMRFTNNDIPLAKECLNYWYKEGCLAWINLEKLSNTTEPKTVIACFAKFPDSKVLWPGRLKNRINEPSIKVDLWGDKRFVSDYPERQIPFLKKYLPEMRIIGPI